MGSAISSLLFQPPPPTYIHPSRHFWLSTDHGSGIPAFYIERPNASITILFSHGNAEDLGMIYDWFHDLSRVLRVNILAYDYTGYGKSSNGIPSEENCYRDIEAAYHYLVEVRHIVPEQIVLYGRSLGSGPSCYLAAKSITQYKRSVGGVILQSPLLSAYRVAFNFRFTMMGDKFPNIDYAPLIQCPVFIVHGTQDEVVPFWHGQDLFLSLQQEWRAKPFWVEGAGHNNIEAMLRSSGTFVTKLMEFLELHVTTARRRRGGNNNKQLNTQQPPIRVPQCVPMTIRELQEETAAGAANHHNNTTNTNTNTNATACSSTIATAATTTTGVIITTAAAAGRVATMSTVSAVKEEEEQENEEEEEEEPQTKKQKIEEDEVDENNKVDPPKAERNDSNEAYFDLTGKKRLTIRQFKGRTLIDIREFYEKDGKTLPGKKGISLNFEQYEALRIAIMGGEVCHEIKSLQQK